MKLTYSIQPPTRPRSFELCRLTIDVIDANSAQHAHYIRYSIRKYRKVGTSLLASLKIIEEIKLLGFVNRSIMSSLDVVAEHGMEEKVAAVLMSLNLRNNRAILRVEFDKHGYDLVYEVRQLTALPTEETLILVRDLEKWLYQDLKNEFKKSKFTHTPPGTAGNNSGEIR